MPREPMTSDLDEEQLLSFLARPQSYGDCIGPVETIETHAARIFLAGAKAFKIKKRVKFAFLDFSSLEQRRRALQRELELNAPHAPGIYIRLLPIMRNDAGNLSFYSGDTVIEYALEMNRFEQSSLLAHIAESGPLPRPLCKDLAQMLAQYHRASPVCADLAGSTRMQSTIAQLVSGIHSAFGSTGAELPAQVCKRISSAYEKISSLLSKRGGQGAVRRCHGDLHLGNIVLLSGQPVPFDALEFDEDLATIDVLYDMAFLLMDLDFRNDRRAANFVLNSYMDIAPIGNEIEGLAALPAFLGTRAAVRAVVAMERARQKPDCGQSDVVRFARNYLSFANDCLGPVRPGLVAVGGLSGTGKSTLAAALAPHIGSSPGALHLRSDVERKRLFGVPETCRLTSEHYTEAVSDQVYGILYGKAERALASGHSVVLDAVASKPAERQAIAAVAGRAGCPFAGIWLEAPLDVKINRVEARRGDPSDADAGVVQSQAQCNVGTMNWPSIDASQTVQQTLDDARRALARAGVL